MMITSAMRMRGIDVANLAKVTRVEMSDLFGCLRGTSAWTAEELAVVAVALGLDLGIIFDVICAGAKHLVEPLGG